MEDLLFGVPHETFWRGVATAGTLLAAGIGYLCKLGVASLAKIARDISILKTTAAVIIERTDQQAERIKMLETSVFGTGKNVG